METLDKIAAEAKEKLDAKRDAEAERARLEEEARDGAEEKECAAAEKELARRELFTAAGADTKEQAFLDVLNPKDSDASSKETLDEKVKYVDSATGNTVLMEMVKNHDWPKAAKTLIESATLTTLCSNAKWSICTQQSFKCEQTRLLDIQARNKNGETALDIAISSNPQDRRSPEMQVRRIPEFIICSRWPVQKTQLVELFTN